ncbi:hypothetical protein NL108_012687 [Boleophthalmus pectinirostris]|nr:hypothetical protein NL108_012687 [Boleophthalmus pectinirostris]
MRHCRVFKCFRFCTLGCCSYHPPVGGAVSSTQTPSRTERRTALREEDHLLQLLCFCVFVIMTTAVQTSSPAQIMLSCEETSSPKHEVAGLDTRDRPFRCGLCTKTFTRSTHLKLHQRTHTGEKPYICEQCGKRFALSSCLLRHNRTHSGERPYQCDRCDRAFSQSSSLKQHLRIQHGMDEGEICKSVAQSSKLCRKRRNKDEPFTCKHCPKSFKRAYHLKMHTRTHTGEKPYSCEKCGKSFALSNAYIRHQRVHTGERPYKCDQCGKGFAQSGTLKHHRCPHDPTERPYRCQHCKIFRTILRTGKSQMFYQQRQTFQLQVLFKDVFQKVRPPETHSEPHGTEAVQLRGLPQELHVVQ